LSEEPYSIEKEKFKRRGKAKDMSYLMILMRKLIIALPIMMALWTPNGNNIKMKYLK
jgi:hypothetical protein